jgi:cation diffusion facilitator family transporter
MVNGNQRIIFCSAIVAFILTGVRVIAGVLSGSLGLLALALFSGLNLITVLLAFYLMQISEKPPDERHNYGHGKIENLFVFILNTLLFLICLSLIICAIHFLVNPGGILKFPDWSYIVLIGSIIFDILYSLIIIRPHGTFRSNVVEFEILHFSSDIWSSIIVLLGIFFTTVGLHCADYIATIIISGFVIIIFFGLYKRTVVTLLDYASKEKIILVESILNSATEINGYSDLRIRTSGSDTLVSFKLYFSPHMKIYMSHNICDSIKKKIFHVVDRWDILIHIEPFNLKNRII